MSIQNERLKNFLEAIDQEARENSEKISAEIEEYTEIELENARKEAEKAASALLDERRRQNRRTVGIALSSGAAEIQSELVAKRGGITERVFEEAREKLVELTKNEAEYCEFLRKSLLYAEKAMGEKAAIVTVRSEDAAVMAKAAEAAGRNPEIRESSEIKIGGLSAQNASHTLEADDTLDSRLAGQREWFLSNCGMSVNI